MDTKRDTRPIVVMATWDESVYMCSYLFLCRKRFLFNEERLNVLFGVRHTKMMKLKFFHVSLRTLMYIHVANYTWIQFISNPQ